MASKTRLFRLLAWAGAVALAGAAYAVAVRALGRGFWCPVWSLTGLYCPGCGVSRMCLRLLRLDFPGAFRANPLLFIALPVIGGLLLARGARYVKTGERGTPRWEERLWLTLAGLFVVYGLLRNLPAFAVLAPA